MVSEKSAQKVVAFSILIPYLIGAAIFIFLAWKSCGIDKIGGVVWAAIAAAIGFILVHTSIKDTLWSLRGYHAMGTAVFYGLFWTAYVVIGNLLMYHFVGDTCGSPMLYAGLGWIAGSALIFFLLKMIPIED